MHIFGHWLFLRSNIWFSECSFNWHCPTGWECKNNATCGKGNVIVVCTFNFPFQFEIIITTIIFWKVYSVVSSNGSCQHKTGGFPYSCLTDLPDCEDKCTSLSSCVAYATNGTHCALIPSDKVNCSAIEMSSYGIKLVTLSKNYKQTATNDLITTGSTGFNCSKIVIGNM